MFNIEATEYHISCKFESSQQAYKTISQRYEKLFA